MDMKIALLVSLTFAFALGLSACGAKKTGPADASELASRSGGVVSGKSAARCNIVSVPAANMEGVLKAYWTGTGYKYDRIQLKITRVPSALLMNANVSMKVLRWGVSNGQQTTNGVPAPIRFLLNSHNVVINEASPALELSSNSINSVISSYGLGSHGVTTSNFFQKVSVLIDEVDMGYDALTFQFFDSARGSGPYASQNALIPAFHANPNQYALQNPSMLLQQLHPHFTNKSAGWTDALYASYFDQLCNL